MKDTDLDRREEETEISQISAFNKNVMATLTAESTPALERVVLEMAERLYSRKLIYFITDLTTDQITNYYRYDIIDKQFFKQYAWREKKDNEELYNHFTDLFEDILALAVSKRRQGRTEGKDIATTLRQEAKDEQLKNRIG